MRVMMIVAALALTGCVKTEIVARSQGNVIVRHLPVGVDQEVLDTAGGACAPRTVFMGALATGGPTDRRGHHHLRMPLSP